MSQGSFKDTFRAVSEYFERPLSQSQARVPARAQSSDDATHTTVANATSTAAAAAAASSSSTPLPAPSFPLDLHLKLDAYLTRHGCDSNNSNEDGGSGSGHGHGHGHGRRPEERESQRLQEKLRSIYRQYVAETTTAKTSAATAPETEMQQAEQQLRHASFLRLVRLVRLVRPMLASKAQLLEWWDVLITPVIDSVGSVGSTRVMLKEAGDCALTFMLPLEGVGQGGSRMSGEHLRGSGREEAEIWLARSFVTRAIDAYLVRAQACIVGNKGLTTVDEYVASEWRSLIMQVGRSRLKFFLETINKYLLEETSRYEILRLLSTFMEQEVPHLHLVQDTPIIQNLLRCLLIDNNTPIISSALTVLMMFLPHIPNVAAAFLPRLFLVYSRVLCWDDSPSMLIPNEEEETLEVMKERINDISVSDGDKNPQLLIDPSWKQSQPALKFKTTSSSPSPDVTPYFTLLYGLYPLNFTSFINKPRRYLKTASYPDIDHADFDKTIMQARSEVLRQAHILHPNFLRFSVEQELAENRWMKMEAAEVLLECLQLSTFFIKPSASNSTKTHPWSSSSSSLRDSDEISSFKSSRTDLNVQTSAEVGQSGENEENPTDARLIEKKEADASPSATSLERILRSSGISSSQRETLSTQRSSIATSDHDRRSSELSLLATDPSLHGSHAAAAAAATASLQRQTGGSPVIPLNIGHSRQTDQRSVSGPATSPQKDDKEKYRSKSGPAADIKHSSNSNSLEKRLLSHQIEINGLRQEVAILRNDVSFERYLKQQHSVYISQLRKKKLEELRLEAETQNLIIENKNLKARLTKVNENLAQLKRETTTSRQQSKKYEESLYLKFRNLNKEYNELKKFNVDMGRELEDTKSKQKTLAGLLQDSQLRERKTFEKLTFCQSELAGRKSLLEELSQMHEQVSKCENIEVQNRMLEFQLESAQNELQSAKRQVASHEAELDRLQKTFRAKIKELNAELASTKVKATQEAQRNVTSALTAEREELSTMRSETERLRRKCQNLSFRLYAIEAGREADAGIAAAKERQQIGGADENSGEKANAELRREPG